MEYLPLTGQRATDRSRLEAQQRATGLHPGDVTQYAYELVNDSCGDGFIKWAVTFTA